MDYLDHKKELRYRITLFVGYALVGVAIALATMILLYQAYGFGIDKKGAVIQNSLTFFSSQPNPANIFVNGKISPKKTNTRLSLPAGLYDIKLTRAGYFDWQRKIVLAGGEVQHFDYPFFFPKQLTTTSLKNYVSPPGLSTQSADQRWLLIQPTASLTDLSLFDLKNPEKAPVELNLPVNILTKATGSESWQLEEWAGDNQHVVLQHVFDGKSEYILVDCSDPSKSLNLNTTLGLNTPKLSLIDKKYDQYYLFDPVAGGLQTATLRVATPVTRLTNVLAYKSYGNNTLLYSTTDGAPIGKVYVKMSVGDRTYNIRTLSANTTYLLDLTKYSGEMYVAVGSTADSRIYIYKDPVGQLNSDPKLPPLTTRVLHVEQVNYLSFSDTAQFIVAENSNQFALYDIENKSSLSYSTTAPIDNPQLHANWMDGHRLTYVSSGKLIVFDYDSLNQQTLMPALSGYLPAFSPNYKYVYSLAPSTIAGQVDLTQTSLLTSADR